MNHEKVAELIGKSRETMVEASNETIDKLGDMIGRNYALNVIIQSHLLTAAVLLANAVEHTHGAHGQLIYDEAEKRFVDIIQDIASRYGPTMIIDNRGSS